MLQFTSTPSTEDMVRDDPLFSVDGTEYAIPSQVPARFGLQLATIFADFGLGAAQVFALRTCLGDAGFNALRQSADLGRADLDKIIEVCIGRCQGQAPKAAKSG